MIFLQYIDSENISHFQCFDKVVEKGNLLIEIKIIII